MADKSIIQPFPAPAFSLKDARGDEYALEDLRGKWALLVFLPGMEQKMSVRLACAYREHWGAFQKLGVPVWAVWAENAAVSAEFSKRFSLPFPLLMDEERKVIRAYSAWVPPSGKQGRWNGVVPTVALMASDGYVTRHWIKVHKGEQNPLQVLDALELYLR
ncbi:MAG: redoxin domain-containing protein [Verrucomicrobia bacterium]|nr:redoxin domain-containing protein [Verrucomicrobiota bacterium]MCH8527907.1 redoxin domain-containing protein [Kiritimatiellia bacterium]